MLSIACVAFGTNLEATALATWLADLFSKLLDSERAGPGYDQQEPSQWGRDWADVSQIRERLQRTPTERLRAAQNFMNTVFRRRSQNGG